MPYAYRRPFEPSAPSPFAPALEAAPSWMNEDPGLLFWSGELRDMHQHYLTLRGVRLVPRRRDFDPMRLPQHLGCMYLAEVDAAGGCRYRLVGTHIADMVGRDVTGRRFEEVYEPEVAARHAFGIHWVAAHRRPLRRYGRSPQVRRHHRYGFEEVLIPLSTDGGTVEQVLGRKVYLKL